MAKRAVLIGINDYADDNVSDLAGCVNDVELITYTLAGAFGFGDGDITAVLDRDATRDHIFGALDELIDATEQGDVALVYYSGHGSQAPDRNDEESDQRDETIVPSDSGRGNMPVRDIVDDELHSYVAALAQKTDQATFVFDSCHSGSVDRILLSEPGDPFEAAHGVARAIPAARSAPEGPPHMRPEAAGGGDASASGIIPQGAYVLIAGCRDNQTSKETEFGGRRQGALTFHLANALGNGNGTLRRAFEKAAQGVRNAVPQQDPVLEGPDGRLEARAF